MSGQNFASSDEVFAYLLRFVNVEKGQKTEFKLDRMRHLCAGLRDPQNAFRSIHVAGSKGKGSVSVMIARVLQAAGISTGLYTSPHLLRWKERISLAGDEVDEAVLLGAMDELFPLINGKSASDFPGGELPTYFELSTLLAFLAFRRLGCEWAVVETGLGGRLDSTNVLDSAASVITPIELEHTEWLGDTIAQIAFEKAGIIKPGRACYLSPQSEEAMQVFRSNCSEKGSPRRELDELVAVRDVAVDRTGTDVRLVFKDSWRPASRSWGSAGELALHSPLIGRIQGQNMALAALAASEIEARVGAQSLAAGLSRASLPARFQVVDGEATVILDGAHTPRSARAALESMRAVFPGPADLLFGCAHDKHHEEMAGILAPHFEEITITRPGDFKQSDPGAVHASFCRALGASEQRRCRLVEDFSTAIATALSRARDSGRPLLVAGSFYLCAEVAARLRIP
ncbi:MAG TPA: folylpolyglutamate synthase/dihydrofolate synthase family protein [Rectinemataceae bacterium]|nr:folylpolyglutamate synthase/dihydrofolate synthase family protein [Rectinemataceae bacterium]